MRRLRRVRLIMVGLALLALVTGLPSAVYAVSIGYFLNDASASPAVPITTAGGTPVAVADLGNLGGLNVLWILNGSNSDYGAIAANAGNLAAFVQAGGVLSFHDRRVTEAAGILPGAGATTFTRSLGTNIDVVTGGTTVTNGPFGTIGNTTLDGGNFSNHGFATAATLPAGAVSIFNNGTDGQIVDFFYPFGLGTVYYSTIPLDFYLGGAGNNPPADAFRGIYAPNEAAFQGGAPSPVPEPATLVLVGTALTGLGWKLRRRR